MKKQQLRNTLSWSHSRALTLARCAREYYMKYYLANSARRNDSTPSAEAAFRLKMLTSLDAAAGSAVHALARAIVSRIACGKGLPSHRAALRYVRRPMRRLWQSSADRERFMEWPRGNAMLEERYYQKSLSSANRADRRDKLEQCVHNLLDWPGWYDLMECDPEAILLFDSFETRSFECGDGVVIPVYAAPDLVYMDRASTWNIVDFKTGAKIRKTDFDQIATYYLWLVLGGVLAPEDATQGLIVNVAMPHEELVLLSAADLPLLEERISASVAEMRSLLVNGDGYRNEPLSEEHFVETHVEALCRHCAFREICRPGIADLR